MTLAQVNKKIKLTLNTGSFFSSLGKLTKATMTVRLQVVAMATLAAKAQTVIVSAVTQDTDVVATSVVSPTWV